MNPLGCGDGVRTKLSRQGSDTLLICGTRSGAVEGGCICVAKSTDGLHKKQPPPSARNSTGPSERLAQGISRRQPSSDGQPTDVLCQTACKTRSVIDGMISVNAANPATYLFG